MTENNINIIDINEVSERAFLHAKNSGAAYPEDVERLAAEGKLNEKDAKGNSLMRYAIVHQNLGGIENLLEHGAILGNDKKDLAKLEGNVTPGFLISVLANALDERQEKLETGKGKTTEPHAEKSWRDKFSNSTSVVMHDGGSIVR